MKKLIAILMVVMLMASMTVTAHAVTPTIKVDMPEISKMQFDIKLDKDVEKAIKNYVAEWVKKIDFLRLSSTLVTDVEVPKNCHKCEYTHICKA